MQKPDDLGETLGGPLSRAVLVVIDPGQQLIEQPLLRILPVPSNGGDPGIFFREFGWVPSLKGLKLGMNEMQLFPRGLKGTAQLVHNLLASVIAVNEHPRSTSVRDLEMGVGEQTAVRRESGLNVVNPAEPGVHQSVDCN